MKEEHNKRLKPSNKKKRNIIIIIIAISIIIASMIFYVLHSNSTDLEPISEVQFDDNSVNQVEEEDVSSNSLDEGVEIVDVSDMPSSANGFPVLGRIVIDKIGINCLILQANTDAEAERALKYGTLKFYGPNVNDPR